MTALDWLGPAQAWASAAGAEHHAPSIDGLIFPAINFIIYAAVLYYFALPPVRGFLRSRREQIIEAIAHASRKKQQAEALVREYKTKLAGVEREVEAIQASLRDDGEREKSKLLNEAQAIAAKLQEDARFLADQELKMARQKLREDMAAQAEATAVELARKNISMADQSRLAEEFIHSIGQAR